jgi:phage terminase large subunit-like protein
MSDRIVGLLEACDDPHLFGFKPYPRQRELLKAIESGPRVQVLCLGRRSGKSTMAGLLCLHNCLFRPDLDAKVRRGERRFAVAVATNRAQARLIVNAARSVAEHSPLIASLVDHATEDEIGFTLPSGARSTLAAFPCSSRGGRGWPISALCLDETAHFVSESDGYQTAERVWEALVPSTAQFGDQGQIVVSSTPWGRDGLFAQLYQQASSGELPDAAAHHATTAQMNPTVDVAFLEREERRDPDGFRGEYLAEFVGSGAAFLDLDRFEVADRGELSPSAATNWVAGIDPAFSSDPFGLALVGRDRTDRQRLLVGFVHASYPPKVKAASFEHRRQVEDELLDGVADVCKRYDARVVTDQFAARAVVDRLQRRGLVVRAEPMTTPSKTAAFGELRARLYDGSLELYRHPELLGELRRLRTKFTAGSAAVVNPRVGRSHGDMAQALALATYEQARFGSSSHVYRSKLPRLRPEMAGLLEKRL